MNAEAGQPDAPLRSGMIAVVGRANTGKSTLLNKIFGEKVSIVSPVAQTTRNRIRAILTEKRGQLVFLDTPGVHKASYDLGKIMNRAARAAVEGVDIALLVLDSSQRPREEDEGWMRRLVTGATPCVAVLNKSDIGGRGGDEYRKLWETIAKEKGTDRQPVWGSVSALTGDGVRDLVNLLFRTVPFGPLLFPEDILTDFPRKLAIADIVREKYLAVLREELPHALAVEIETIDEQPDKWHATGTVFVEKNSQKGIVLGAKGRLLKKVILEAEQELKEMFGRPISLELWVKIEEKWTRNYWFLKRLGYTT